jgi:hypothetical protein
MNKAEYSYAFLVSFELDRLSRAVMADGDDRQMTSAALCLEVLMTCHRLLPHLADPRIGESQIVNCRKTPQNAVPYPNSTA